MKEEMDAVKSPRPNSCGLLAACRLHFCKSAGLASLVRCRLTKDCRRLKRSEWTERENKITIKAFPFDGLLREHEEA